MCRATEASSASTSTWILRAVILCMFGFFKEVRPSEGFLTEYLIGPRQNLTLHQVNAVVYPVWTYSYLALLIPVFMLTDVAKYKPVIVIEGLAYIATWSLLLFSRGVFAMQMMQFVYGLATATEIAYYSYIYSVVDQRHFQTVSSLTRGCALVGRFVSGALGQLLVSMHVEYYYLNCVSMGCVCLAFIISIFLPHSKPLPTISISADDDDERMSDSQSQSQSDAQRSHLQSTSSSLPYLTASENYTEPLGSQSHSSDLASFEYSFYSFGSYQHEQIQNQPDRRASSRRRVEIQLPPESISPQPTPPPERQHNCCVEYFIYIATAFKTSYSNKSLLKWSVWWAIATCGNFQVGNYVQNLWETIYPSQGHSDVVIYNGAVEAAATLTGAIAAFLLILPKANWSILGELLMGFVSLIDGCLLILMAVTSSIWEAYIFYVIFRASYQMVITIATCQIACHLGHSVQAYALVFGCNTFLALILQTILTLVVVDENGLAVSINVQFFINGGYFLLIGCLFIVLACCSIYKLGCVRWWSLRRSNEYREL